MVKIENILAAMTTEEKAALVSGTDFMYTNPIPRLHVPALRMSDGPHGLRVQKEAGDNGVTGSEPATAFPTAVTTASGWNPENLRKMGEAIAEECKYYGVNILLGPGANIKRNPLCGRNFEYFSEDPLLAGKLAAAEIQGVQSQGVGVSMKHFALNNSENYRFMGGSIADLRVIHELYLRVFKIAVKEAHPVSIMCAYNKINGEYCCQNKWLLTDMLRTEWGFDGLVMTDWGATHNRLKMLAAGCDLEMPGDAAICRKWILDGVKSGALSAAELDKAARNVLRLMERTAITKMASADWDKHHALAAEIAADCAVLLKNDGLLPLNKAEKVLVIGDLFNRMRYQGAGSSMITPARLTTPRNAFDEMGISYAFCRGYEENKTEANASLVAEAVEKASQYEKILVFAGLTDYVESEGGDRENMCLPENQLALLEALVKAGKRVAVVLFGGAPVELPFADSVSAILNMYLPGQNGGTAAAWLLFGEANPGGRLAETWPMAYADVPFGDSFGKTQNEVYKESVYVGYRYYLTANKKVRYPFGYGLSYTTFDWEDMQITDLGKRIQVSCTVKNTGTRDCAEVVQLYVAAPESAVWKPKRELRAFAKVYLKAGEQRRVELSFDKDDLRYFDIRRNDWVIEQGTYELLLCSDCEAVKLHDTIVLDGETAASPYDAAVDAVYRRAALAGVTDSLFTQMSGLQIPPLPPKTPIRLESRFSDLQATFMGRILYNAVLGVARKQMKEALRLPPGEKRDNQIKGAQFLERILSSNSLITMSMSAANSFPYSFAEGFAALANGHILRGARCFLTKIKVPALPKEQEK